MISKRNLRVFFRDNGVSEDEQRSIMAEFSQKAERGMLPPTDAQNIIMSYLPRLADKFIDALTEDAHLQINREDFSAWSRGEAVA